MTGPPTSRSCPCRCFWCLRTTTLSQKHIAEFFALLGGGVREPGWLNTQLSKSRLAVVPGYSHYKFHTLGGGAADYRQVPGRFAHECAGRRSSRLAGRAATGEEAVSLDQKPERISPLLIHRVECAYWPVLHTLRVWAWKENPDALIARVLSGWSTTLPESLFLKALTEGLPMMRPGAVDICRPMMVRYSVIYGVTR